MLRNIFLFIFVALTTSAPTLLNPSLEKTLVNKGTTNIIIRMSNGTQHILEKLNQINFKDRATRLNTVVNTLKTHAVESQKELLNLLSSIQGLTFHSFWISNEVFIKSANIDIVKKVATIEGIGEIYEEYIVQLDNTKFIESKTILPRFQLEQGIKLIQADLVWFQLENNGTGAIIANIDTGVRGTHEALKNNFLGDYGWFDPSSKTLLPHDPVGHGTHRMGIMVGDFGIGVAPGAKWMACRGCTPAYCSAPDLAQCAQFILCPTLADGSGSDCSKAPHVVSNSWGGGQGHSWFDIYIQAWRTGGIIPVFAIGNSGPLCRSANSPGDTTIDVIAVGATTFTDSLAHFSSVGPSMNGMIKPNICAPGENVRSAAHTSDNGYVLMSGTNVAAPHISGVIGLLAAENQKLSFENTNLEKFLYEGTDRKIVETGRNCGRINETTFPNNACGWGRVNAFKSVQFLQNSMKTV